MSLISYLKQDIPHEELALLIDSTKATFKLSLSAKTLSRDIFPNSDLKKKNFFSVYGLNHFKKFNANNIIFY